jgi:hypothetical protein
VKRISPRTDVLAHLAVTAGAGAGQLAALVDELHGEPVQLRLHHVGEGLLGVLALPLQQHPQPAGDAAGRLVPSRLEPPQVVGVERVAQRQHGDAVRERLQAVDGVAADPPRRAVRRGEIGEAGLQADQLLEEQIVLPVVDLGLPDRMVEVVVPPQLRLEPGHAGRRRRRVQALPGGPTRCQITRHGSSSVHAEAMGAPRPGQ